MALAGCDTGYAVLDPNGGPPLRVVSTYPADGAGFECSTEDPTCGVPVDTRFEIRFDRYLLPSTTVRQSFSIYSGDPSNPAPPPDLALTPRYDVVERVVTYELPPGFELSPNTYYTAELRAPLYGDDFGFRAFDGVPLDSNGTTKIHFLTSNHLDEEPWPDEATATCEDAVRIFNGACLGGGCHGASSHVMGMNLSTPDDLARSVIGRVAHQAETGASTGHPTENPARFGVAMPRVDPGRPDNSYLMYKLLAAPENYRLRASDPDLCGSSHRAPVDPAECVPASAEETERLRAWFLRGVAMPRLKEPDEDQAPAGVPDWLIRAQLRDVGSWIFSGASCP